MGDQSTVRPAEQLRGLPALALARVRSRQHVRRLMVVGSVASIMALAVAMSVTDAGTAMLVFGGALFLSCAVSCFVGWFLSARAMTQIRTVTDELQRRRGAEGEAVDR